MLHHPIIRLVPLFIMLCCAAVSDIRSRKIRNWLTLAMVLTGLTQSFMSAAGITPLQSLLGLLTGFGITFVLFAMGALGGGDVKLMAGIGAWLGPGPAVAVFVIEAIIGLVVVLVQAAVSGRLTQLFRNSALIAINVAHVRELGVEHVKSTGQSAKSIDRPLPYAVPVLAAVAIMAIRTYCFPA